jgi:hypothetical protein
MPKPQIESSKNASYVEISDRMNNAAFREQLKTDAVKCAECRKCSKEGEKSFVKATNISRELGLSFEGYYLPSDAASAENFFNKNYAKVLHLRFDQFLWVKSIAKKLPEKCKDFSDIYPVLQLEFFAMGLLEKPQREGIQQSHSTTPVHLFFDILNKTRTKLDKVVEGVTTWAPEVRDDVRKQIAEFRAWIDNVEKQIE